MTKKGLEWRTRRRYRYKAICFVSVLKGVRRGKGGRLPKGRESLSVVYMFYCVCLKYLVVWTKMLIEESQTDDCLLGSWSRWVVTTLHTMRTHSQTSYLWCFRRFTWKLGLGHVDISALRTFSLVTLCNWLRNWVTDWAAAFNAALPYHICLCFLIVIEGMLATLPSTRA